MTRVGEPYTALRSFKFAHKNQCLTEAIANERGNRQIRAGIRAVLRDFASCKIHSGEPAVAKFSRIICRSSKVSGPRKLRTSNEDDRIGVMIRSRKLYRIGFGELTRIIDFGQNDTRWTNRSRRLVLD